MTQIKDHHKALLAQLKQPFDPKFVKWRVGATNADKTKGIALAYIDSREVNKRLDEVCGIANWRDRLIEVTNGFVSEIDIKIDDEWVTRSNSAGNTQVEAIKGGASDAFKRSASKWGIGRYLYYLPNVWVKIVPQGKSHVLAEIPELPDWALPGKVENWEDIAELEADETSGADVNELASLIITNLDSIRSAETIEDLRVVVEKLSSEDQSALSTEIDNKTRELLNGNSTIDSSPSTPEK